MTDRQRAQLLATARRHLARTTQGHVQYAKTGKGSEWKAALAALDRLEADLAPKTKVPNLGPVVSGGVALLLQDLTHPTGGLDGYPALDDGFGHPGLAVIAPEPLEVTRQSSARRRDGTANGKAFYATGASGLRYWFGHVDAAPPVGAKFKKGAKLAAISADHEAPHLHVGINAKNLIGRELAHHDNYTHGAEKIGLQLKRALE
jgi:hypothetical protein